ncbi:TIGR03085 family metal-binding protein [Nocardioides bruguierae]|uniref:TIGR03085 family metal-binding protein n=1 Tax=Nocardioides bruguierae TaxID=2945102 RepID=UPI00202177D3|nr:TIGR03085 family metal-binding protein [Nocardioides bruguierae]MCL8027566.1 TIGR03085 family metal-binding protein [Nocardioides bruguierae]
MTSRPGPAPFVRRERAALCDLLLEVGPDAPTLCSGWTARDLLAHLLVREREPWMAAGVVVSRLTRLTETAMGRSAHRSFDEEVARFRSPGPLVRPARLDAVANTVELVVHHEDVRRAAASWTPRALPADDRDVVWRAASRMGRVLARPARGGLVAARTDTDERHVLRSGPDPVLVSGDPVEVTLFLFGRPACDVTLDGSPTALDALDRDAFGF